MSVLFPFGVSVPAENGRPFSAELFSVAPDSRGTHIRVQRYEIISTVVRR